MQTRRSFLAAGAAAGLVRGATPKPNFLFILADDHAGYVLGADGNPLAQTPRLDLLASQGTRFASHYCNSPVCTPSRQSFFTGEMPSTDGVTVLSTALSESKPTLAHQLHSAGYYTGVFGKMHFNHSSYAGMHGFDGLLLESDLPGAWSKDVRPVPVPKGTRVKPPWRPFVDPARIWLNADKLPYGCYYDDMPGTYLARRAATFFQRHQNVPFALWVSFLEPHSPFDFPVEYTNLYSPSQFSAPPVPPADLPRIPLCFRPLTDKDKQGIIAAYYTSVNYVDRNIGLVLDALAQQGMEQNTLVVYMPDHSYVLGHHGWFEKCCGYEQALRVPLMMRWPGHIQQGTVVRDFTESVDVAPTILEMLGVGPIPLQQGQSLRPYLQGLPHPTPRSHIFSQYLENEEAYIRTDQFKFMYCSGKRYRKDNLQTDHPTPGRYVRLYNLWSDPNEITDISQSYPTLVADFEGMILDRFLKTHPEAGKLPKGLTLEQQIEFFLRPRDATN